MRMGRVVGEVIATRKSEKMTGFKLLLVRMTDDDGSYAPPGDTVGDYTVAIDAVGAGVGEIVLTVAGSSAREDPKTKSAATDTTIISIVDQVTNAEGNVVCF